jgi:beta-lactamase class D
VIIGAVVAVGLIVTGVLVLWPSKDPATNPAAVTVPSIGSTPTVSTGKVVDEFLILLSAGKAPEAAALTDDPAAAQAAISVFAKNAAGTVFKYTRPASTEPKAGDTTATAPVKGSWSRTGPSPWEFPPGNVSLVLKDNKWLVKWQPSVLFPKLQNGQNLAVLGDPVGNNGDVAVAGDDGKPLANWAGGAATPVDSKISPLIMKTLVSGAVQPGAQDSRRLSIVDAAGKEVETLVGTKAPPAEVKPVQSTLNAKMSIAAQNAVDGVSQATYLVAIKPSTGAIVAVAQNAAAGSALDAFNGQYQPGSTFKVITATAAIEQQGLTPESQVDCPGQGTYNGRTIHNANFELGQVPLRRAFAKSCNTSFAQIASQLPADALHKAANQYGLNADFTIPGVKSELGKVEDSDNGARQVENAIGQGTVKASPLGMALVAATVVKCGAVTPQLRKDEKTEVGTGYQGPQASVCGPLRQMMGDVVQSGTAAELKGLATGGKTGTAETTNNGTEAHGWFIGFRGDLAFAVLVKNGQTSSVAVRAAGVFLRGI